jgi:hypothetical protein
VRPSIAMLLFALAPLAVAATDISGKWTGSMDKKTPDGQVDSTPVVAEFKLDGKTVTGTANVPGFDPLMVQRGMLDGDQLTFEVQGDDGNYAVRLTVVSASELKGEVKFTDPNGRAETAGLTFSRN